MRYFTMICIFLIILSLGLSAAANPFICDDTANTCTYLATVTEPTKTTGGTVLTNLKQTNLKTSLNGGPYGVALLPATSPTGGGTATKNLTFTTTACAVTTLTVKASATNLSNVEGPETVPVTVKRDRTADPTCAPAAPGLTVN